MILEKSSFGPYHSGLRLSEVHLQSLQRNFHMEAPRTIGQEQQSRYIVVPLHCGGFHPETYRLCWKVCEKEYRNRKAVFTQRTDL